MYLSMAVISVIVLLLNCPSRWECLFPGEVSIPKLSWISYADLDSNCKPSLDVSQNPPKWDTRFTT